ncbi:hypothetical protein STIUS_v1c03420 [Spiroplasma sp. TIUS-1]|uniref:hypothetical protein n=1 Tax=Spiroplasma sp. TIUS-1 TaxID=216963 RepID=UPI001398AE2B|nr:hypothetical protein [Spiroplasma sp. TIUS-1]QHX35896.1 hypothetical protein STIUS_v1c03420 [Spiroplasma sp. TIUS-1]
MSLEFIKRQLESSVDFSELRKLVRGSRVMITLIITLSIIFCGLISILPFVVIVQEMKDIWHVILPITCVATLLVAGMLIILSFNLVRTTAKIRKYINSLDLENIYKKSFNKILKYEGLTFKSLNIVHSKLIFNNTKKWDAFSFYEDQDLFSLPFDKNTATFDYKGHELVFQSQSVILKRVPMRVIAANRKKGLETKSKKVINIYNLIWKNQPLVKKYKGVSVITGSAREEFFQTNNEEFNTKFFVDDECENEAGAVEMFDNEFVDSLLDSSRKRNHITFHGLVVKEEGVVVCRTAETSNYQGEISIVKNAFATSEERVIDFVTKNINADILNFARSVRYLVGLD